MFPSLDFTAGKGGGFDFGDFAGGSLYGGDVEIDARTSTSGATATNPLVLVAGVVAVVIFLGMIRKR